VKKQLDIPPRQKFDEVIEANLNYLVRFAAVRVGSKADGEDVVHEAVRRLLETDISKIRRDSLRMYLFRIVYNPRTDY